MQLVERCLKKRAVEHVPETHVQSEGVVLGTILSSIVPVYKFDGDLCGNFPQVHRFRFADPAESDADALKRNAGFSAGHVAIVYIRLILLKSWSWNFFWISCPSGRDVEKSTRSTLPDRL